MQRIIKGWLIALLILAIIASILVGVESFFFGILLLPLIIILAIIIILGYVIR
jgi:hypothetical protein